MLRMPSLLLGVYRHYKGKLYRVIAIGRHSETEEPLVIYQGLYVSPEFGDRPWWVRPLASFQETVEIDGISRPRFTYLGENEAAPTNASTV